MPCKYVCKSMPGSGTAHMLSFCASSVMSMISPGVLVVLLAMALCCDRVGVRATKKYRRYFSEDFLKFR